MNKTVATLMVAGAFFHNGCVTNSPPDPLRVISNVSVFHELQDFGTYKKSDLQRARPEFNGPGGSKRGEVIIIRGPHVGSIKVVPADKSMESDLEFKHYKKLIEVKLLRNMFTVVGKDEHADYVALVSYGLGEGQEKIASIPYVVNTSPGFQTHQGSFDNKSSFDSIGYSGITVTYPSFQTRYRSESYTVYKRNLAVDIFTSSDGNKVYQGRAVSKGSSPNLTCIMPPMIDSLFEKFPGANGKTRTSSKDFPC